MHTRTLVGWMAMGLSALAPSACGGTGSTGSTAPSCEALNKQFQACPNIPPASKQGFAASCAQPRIDNDSCRGCLDGKLCGNTETCDPVCGK